VMAILRAIAPILDAMTNRSICFLSPATVSLLLRGSSIPSSSFNLHFRDEELLLNLLIWYLKKEGRTDLNMLVS
jgi:hypothetical protein